MPDQKVSGSPTTAPDAGDVERFLLRSRADVLALLRRLYDGGELMTAYYVGSEFILTAVLGIDAERNVFFFDCGPSAAANRQVVGAKKLVFVGTLDKVKVQFETGPATLVELDGRPAFVTGIPHSALKFQRREFYRLLVPVSKPLRCVLVPEEPERFTYNVLDISLGGLGLMGYSPELDWSQSRVFEGCRIALPDVGTVVSNLQIKNCFDITLRNGIRTRRTGFAFVGLTPAMQNLVSRYIIKLDRERRASMAGG